MCGSQTDLFKVVIEGTELKVCKQCAGFGKVVEKIRIPVKEKGYKKEQKEKEEEHEIVQVIVPDYAKKVKNARESKGLKQEEVAKKINEKESVIHKVETGHYKPNMVLAKKLEKFFKIKLIEEYKSEKTEKTAKSSSEGLTIGDLIKLK